jgi:hypothetical protein
MRLVSNKDLRVATTHGAVVVFKANEPREVSDTIAAVAMQMGAKQIADTPKPILDEPSIPVEELLDLNLDLNLDPEEEVMDVALVDALKQLIELGNPDDFKADGTPKAAVVNKAVGRTVRSDEREKAWEIALNA